MRNRTGDPGAAWHVAASPRDAAMAPPATAAGPAAAAARATARRCGRAAWQALLLATACASLTACSLMTWALGDKRSEAPTSPPVTPASPLGTSSPASPAPASPAPAPSGETRADADAGAPGPAAAPLADTKPPGTAPSEAARPGGAASTSPVPSPPTPSAAPAPSPAPGAPPASSGRSSGVATPGAPAAAPRPSAPQGVAGRYAVQVGAFRTAAAAESAREQLAAELVRAPDLAGLTASLRVAEQGGLHRVWLGGVNSLAAARALAARIREATGRETFVVRP